MTTGGFSQPASLISGNDLSNWEQRGGSARYQLQDGVIIGTSVRDAQNTFLCTKAAYDDFILTFEVRQDPGINSGIQIRSESLPNYQNGRVHGYQVELDPSLQRLWTGGIYDEGRRGWLYPLTRNPKGQAAYVLGAWNQVRIEAIGPYIRTWINGIQCANLVDRLTAKGFIALQVHGIGSNDTPGKQIRWRNLQIRTDDLDQHRWPVQAYAPEISHLINQLTEAEKSQGWRLLWDGETLAGWSAQPRSACTLEDECLSLSGQSKLLYQQGFTDFELRFDVRFSEATRTAGLRYGNRQGADLTMTLLDRSGERSPGSLAGLIPSKNLSESNNTDLRFSDQNGWNRVRTVVRDGHVEHWLNQIKVVTYDLNGQTFQALLNQAGFRSERAIDDKAAGTFYLSFETVGPVEVRSIAVREKR
jgi:hypothetical protein